MRQRVDRRANALVGPQAQRVVAGRHSAPGPGSLLVGAGRPADLQEIGDEQLAVAGAQVAGVAELLDAPDLRPVLAELGRETRRPRSRRRGPRGRSREQLGGAALRQDRQLHDVGDALRRERVGELREHGVQRRASPVVDRPVPGDLLLGIDRRLVDARHDDLVALLRNPREDVDPRRGHPLADAVAMGVGLGVAHGALVDVDGAHVRRAVERELDAEDAGAAADVQAALMRADRLVVEVAPRHEARVGWRHDPGIGDEVGELQAAPAGVPGGRSSPARAARSPGAGRAAGARGRVRDAIAGLGLLEQLARRRDVRRADAAAAADDLRSLLAPAQRHRRVLGAADARLEAPARVRVVAEVRIHAERQVGEVAQVGHHPVDVVGRDAVDHQRADAHLLEAGGRAAERVALGPAPVLPVDAAQAVPAAPERQPDRKPGVEQRLDRGEQRRPHDRERLEQDEIGRLVGEEPREQPDRALALGGVDVAVDRERDRAAAPRARPRRPPGARGAARAARDPSSAPARVEFHSGATPCSSALGSPHVFVEMTSQPAAT